MDHSKDETKVLDWGHRTAFGLVRLVALVCTVVACRPLDEGLTLREGELCTKDSECRSGFCEASKVRATRICCLYSCGSNEACTPQGLDCKDCETLQCTACDPTQESCNAVEQPYELGQPCSSDDECITGSCDVAVGGVSRCCDSQCIPEGHACDTDGTCVFQTGNEPVGPEASHTSNLDGATSANASVSPVAPDRCGDGVTSGQEECDGESNCTSKCQLVVCGNNRVEEGEGCDPPQLGTCSDRCQAIRCGDGVLAGTEECEQPETSTCNKDCYNVACGDGRVDEEDGEQCDPPTPGSCNANCKKFTCGNGVVEEGEGCDPPIDGECSQLCTPSGCGDGVVNGDEECEPTDEGCSEQCRKIDCGNGIVEAGEECEPSGTETCSDDCLRIECGNARVDPGETCDPPKAQSCDSKCASVVCGDGVLSEGEQCDPVHSSPEACSDKCVTIGEDGFDYLYTFDANVQDWIIDSTDPSSMEPNSTLTFDTQNGDVSPGCLKVYIPFSGVNQKVEFQAMQDPALDLRGRVLRMRVRLQRTEENEDADPMQAKIFAKSGANWDYISGEWMYFTPDTGWVDLTLDVDNPLLVPTGEHFPDNVRALGIELRTPDVSDKVVPATLYVDSVSY